jgi:hypothetical protein
MNLFVDMITSNKISVNEMSVDKMFVCKMPVNKMSVDKMSQDKMSLLEMPCCQPNKTKICSRIRPVSLKSMTNRKNSFSKLEKARLIKYSERALTKLGNQQNHLTG